MGIVSNAAFCFEKGKEILEFIDPVFVSITINLQLQLIVLQCLGNSYIENNLEDMITQFLNIIIPRTRPNYHTQLFNLLPSDLNNFKSIALVCNIVVT